MIPTKNAGYDRLLTSNDIPADIIHAVSVVPMLAPMMTEMACASVSKPAFTNETVITVVAVEDCTEAVTNVPVSIPVKRLVVMAPKTCRSCGPAIFCSASLMVFIPNIRRASEPRSVKITQIDILNVLISATKIRNNLQNSKYFASYLLCRLLMISQIIFLRSFRR